MEELIEEYRSLCHEDISSFSKAEKVLYYKNIAHEIDQILSKQVGFDYFEKFIEIKRFALSKIYENQEVSNE